MNPRTTPIRRAYADVAEGQVHYATCGPADAPPVLLLHQTPRSWREYAAVLPRLGQRYRAIAMDTVGFGDSMAPPWPPSIERWAAVAGELLDVLGIRRVHVVGHHTGGVVAVELAAQRGDRVASLVLSSTPFVDAHGRRRRRERPPIDAVPGSDDGSHLQQLWQRRAAFYPTGRADLLEAFVTDALRAADGPEVGHQVVAAYRMETRIGLLTQPVLVIRAGADPYASPEAATLCARLPQARLVDIADGMVPLPDQLPDAFADTVTVFLDALDVDAPA